MTTGKEPPSHLGRTPSAPLVVILSAPLVVILSAPLVVILSAPLVVILSAPLVVSPERTPRCHPERTPRCHPERTPRCHPERTPRCHPELVEGRRQGTMVRQARIERATWASGGRPIHAHRGGFPPKSRPPCPQRPLGRSTVALEWFYGRACTPGVSKTRATHPTPGSCAAC